MPMRAASCCNCAGTLIGGKTWEWRCPFDCRDAMNAAATCQRPKSGATRRGSVRLVLDQLPALESYMAVHHRNHGGCVRGGMLLDILPDELPDGGRVPNHIADRAVPCSNR